MSNDSASLPPDAASLHQAALYHLARYAATEAGLRRVLQRRIDRWAKAQPGLDRAVLQAMKPIVDQVVVRLAEAGAVSDQGFAEMRAKSLLRGGKSNRSVQASLIGKGVAPGIAREAAPLDAETELAAALLMVRRRRLGAYRVAENADAAVRLKELGRLARAGFSREIAQQALGIPVEEAERRIRELRQ